MDLWREVASLQGPKLSGARCAAWHADPRHGATWEQEGRASGGAFRCGPVTGKHSRNLRWKWAQWETLLR